MIAVLPPTETRDIDAQLRDELYAFVTSAPSKRVAKLHKVVSKMSRQEAKKRKPRVSTCTPHVGCSRWVPKHVEMAQHALKLIEEANVGLRSAPCASETFQFKLVTSEIAAQVGAQEKQLPTSKCRAHRAEASVLVASLVARVVEVAASLKESDTTQHEDALIVKQGFREHPGWSATTSRGSGVAFNTPGRQLFMKAVETVKARVNALSSSDCVCE